MIIILLLLLVVVVEEVRSYIYSVCFRSNLGPLLEQGDSCRQRSEDREVGGIRLESTTTTNNNDTYIYIYIYIYILHNDSNKL